MSRISNPGTYVIKPVITLPQLHTNQLDKKFTQFYREAMIRMLRLTQNQQCLLMYCIEKMNPKTGIVGITGSVINEMNEYYMELGIIKVPYKINTVQQGLSRLAKMNIIVKKGPGAYLVNQALFSRANDSDRYNSIEMFISISRSGWEIKIDKIL
jgi:hypothetical protein